MYPGFDEESKALTEMRQAISEWYIREIDMTKELYEKTKEAHNEQYQKKLKEISIHTQIEILRIKKQAKEMTQNEKQYVLLCSKIDNQKSDIEQKIRNKLQRELERQINLAAEWHHEQWKEIHQEYNRREDEYNKRDLEHKRKIDERLSQYKSTDYNNNHNESKPYYNSFNPNNYYSLNNNSGPRCPKCQSSKIYQDSKGYSVTKGEVGAMAFGPVGLVGGMLGSKKQVKRCGSCGHSF